MALPCDFVWSRLGSWNGYELHSYAAYEFVRPLPVAVVSDWQGGKAPAPLFEVGQALNCG